MPTIREFYEARLPVLVDAERRLKATLAEVVANIEDKELVRASVTQPRIKDLSSIERKAAAKGWKSDEALSMCGDLIGGRVVCNNIEDVYRFAELLKEYLTGSWGGFEIQDQIKNPNPSGYRALHVNFRLDVATLPLISDLVPCEIQIRSRLEDTWAELVHDDIYKHTGLPPALAIQARQLADLLSTADKIAGDIRSQVRAEVAAPANQPDLGILSREGLNFIFRDTFGRSLPDYALRQAESRCKKLGIISLKPLSQITKDQTFRDQVIKTYRSVMPATIQIEEVFMACIFASGRGETAALSKVRSEARREWRDIEATAKREMVTSLPDTFDELVDRVEDPQGEADIEGWAAALDATSKCAICPTYVVQVAEFAEAAVEHYDIPEHERDKARDRLAAAVSRSAADTGGWGGGFYCAYHNEQAAKDD